MKTSRISTTLALACLVALGGCRAEPQATAGKNEPAATASTNAGAGLQAAMDKARKEMSTENITLSSDGAKAKAEITPQGDLLIDGRTVPVTPEQRRLLLDHRAQVMAIASAGMDIGVQGADLAAHAVGEALRGVFSGEPDRIEERIKSHEGSLRKAALKLCDRLPALLASQQKLAAAVPEFAPYATMTGDDVDDCRKDTANSLSDPPPAPPAPPAPPPPPAPTV